MSDSWTPPPSRLDIVNRTMNSRLKGTVNGRMRGTSPVAKPGPDADMMPTPAEIVASVVEVFENYSTTVGYTTLINSFITALGDVINSETFNSVVLQFIDNILQEITEYLNTYNNSTTENFTQEIIQEITYYVNNHDNSTVQNFGGSIIEALTQYIDNHSDGDIWKNFIKKLGDEITNNYGIVRVQAEEPDVTAIGSLWFDTDAF